MHFFCSTDDYAGVPIFLQFVVLQIIRDAYLFSTEDYAGVLNYLFIFNTKLYWNE